MFSKKIVIWLLSCLVIGLGLFLLPEISYAQVAVNEFSSYESTGDWVELYAIEDTDISGWILRDTASTVMKTIPQGITIGPTAASNFYVVEVSNRLNVGGDLIKLLKSDDSTLVDQVSYGDQGGVCAPGSGESIGRYPDANSTIERFSTPTKGGTNNNVSFNSCPTPTPEPTLTPTPMPTNTPTPISTKTPTPVPTATKTPTPQSTATKSPTPKSTPTSLAESAATGEDLVLGLRNELDSTSSPSSEAAGTGKKFPVFPVILIVTGFLCIAGAVFFFVKNNVKKDI